MDRQPHKSIQCDTRLHRIAAAVLLLTGAQHISFWKDGHCSTDW